MPNNERRCYVTAMCRGYEPKWENSSYDPEYFYKMVVWEDEDKQEGDDWKYAVYQEDYETPHDAEPWNCTPVFGFGTLVEAIESANSETSGNVMV